MLPSCCVLALLNMTDRGNGDTLGDIPRLTAVTCGLTISITRGSYNKYNNAGLQL